MVLVMVEGGEGSLGVVRTGQEEGGGGFLVVVLLARGGKGV